MLLKQRKPIWEQDFIEWYDAGFPQNPPKPPKTPQPYNAE